jgi:predicted transcriptional regulator
MVLKIFAIFREIIFVKTYFCTHSVMMICLQCKLFYYSTSKKKIFFCLQEKNKEIKTIREITPHTKNH